MGKISQLHSAWGAVSDLEDVAIRRTQKDPLLLGDETSDFMGRTIKQAMDLADKEQQIICLCGTIMNGVGDGAHCPAGCSFLDKPIHNLGVPASESQINEMKKPLPDSQVKKMDSISGINYSIDTGSFTKRNFSFYIYSDLGKKVKLSGTLKFWINSFFDGSDSRDIQEVDVNIKEGPRDNKIIQLVRRLALNQHG